MTSGRRADRVPCDVGQDRRGAVLRSQKGEGVERERYVVIRSKAKTFTTTIGLSDSLLSA